MDTSTVDAPVQGVPPGLTAEPLDSSQPAVRGVPAGLTAEPIVKGVPPGVTAEPIAPKPAVGPTDMSKVAGAAPGTPTPQQVAGVKPDLPVPTKAQGTREGWMPGDAERNQVAPVTGPVQKALETPLQIGPSAETMLGPDATKRAQEYGAKHPVTAGVVQGVQDTVKGMSTPENIGLLLALPESRLISAFFAAQAAHGAYSSAEDAYQSFRKGSNKEAAQYATEAGLNGLMGALAGYHAAHGHAAPAAAETPQANVTNGTDVPNVPRGANSEETPKIGETEAETDRPVLHQSPHPEVNQAAATAEHPIVKTQLADAIKPIDGAELAGARAEKEPERVDEKIEDGQSPRTIRDYSGYRIAVDSPEAKDQVVKALKERFEVPNEQDEFNEGNAETGFHGHTLQVREPGSPISHEVQVLPREVADKADARHSLYEKARTGDKDAAAQMKAANEADWEQFHARTNSEKGGSEKPEQEPTKGKPASEPKYKFGSTQANKALKVAREKIAPEDLMPTGMGANAKGIEDDPHVTVRYGIQGEDVEGVKKYLEQQAPFEATLGKTGEFPASEHSDGAVPIIAPIDAPELHRIEAEIDKHGDFAERSFPDYKPHATLGYVKPEAASKYVGMPETEGKRFKISSIGISDRNGEVTEVPLKGQSAMPAEAKSSDDSSRPWMTESVIAPEGDHERASGSQSSRLPSELTRSMEPSESVKQGGMTLGSIDPSSKKIVQQSPGTVEEQMARAKEVAPAFGNILDDLAKHFGATHTGPNLKGEARIQEKITEGKRSPETISDYIRARMPFDSVEGIRDAVKEIAKRYGSHDVDDFLDDAKKGGYRAVHMQIHLPNGQSAELQMAPREIFDAQEDAHKDYEIFRDANSTPQQKIAAFADLERKFGAAWDKYKARTSKPVEKREVQGPDKDLTPGAVGKFPVSDLKFDPKRFQYKLNTDEGGTTNLLKGQRWNPDLAGVISVWRDPADGKVYVVNGHHRAQLARSSGVDAVDVRMLNADTPEQARTIGALQNIAEGRGTAIDAAKFFRDTGLTLDDLSKKGISLGEATASNGIALSRLDQSLFDKTVSGQMRLGRAIAIGDATDVPEQQEALVKLIQRAEMKGRRVHDDTIEELARMVKGAGEHTDTQQTLFGAQEMRKNLALEKAEVSAYIREQIGKEKRLFQSVADESKAGKLAVAGNKIEAGKNREIAQSAAQAQELYDKLSVRAGNLDDVLNQAARALADGKETPNAVKSRAYEEARKSLAQALAPGQGSGPAGSGPVAPTARKVEKNAPVTLPDGSAGVVQFVQPGINGGPAVARVRLSSGEMVKSVRADKLQPIQSPKVDPDAAWIGVDLDKTMAQYKDFKGPEFIGKPIPAMVERIRNILKNGEEVDGKLVKDVRVFTARVADDQSGEARAAIEAWTQQNLGKALPATNVKDPRMVRVYDDRAVQVEENTGKIVGDDNAKHATQAQQATQENSSRNSDRTSAGVADQSGAARSEPSAVADVHAGDERRGDQSAVPADRGPKPAAQASTAQDTTQRALAEAKARKPVENLLRARTKTTTLKDVSNAKVTVLNSDAYALLNRLITPEDSWRGAALDPANASRWIAKLRSYESRLRQIPVKAAADAARALVMDLDKAREEDGSLLLLRSDHDPATVREELIHRWQNKTGLRSSAAMREVAERPDFEHIAQRLKALGYDMSAEDQAAELVAKAMAGDPEMEWDPQDQNDVVLSALKAAVDTHGAKILENLPPTDAVVKPAIEEARKYAQNEDRGDQGTPGERLGGSGEQEKSPGQRERGSAPGEGQKPTGAGSKRGLPEEGSPESKLTLFKRLSKRLTGEQALPGMEGDVRAQDDAAAEQRGRDLTTDLLQPGKDISKATGEMERNSPLFRGTDANPQGSLFKRAEKQTTVTTGNHDTGKSLDDMIRDLAKAPDRPMSMEERIAQASDTGLRGVGEVKDKLDSTWAKMKGSTAGIWDAWNRPAPWTNFFESLKGLRNAEFSTALELDAYQKELKRIAPSDREREAMTVFGEAENDQQLRRWASQADNLPDKRWSNAFKDAQHLSDQQKSIAMAHRTYYDQQLKVLTDAGLLPAGASRYVMHMFASDPQTLQQLRSVTDFSELAPNPSFLNRRVYKNYFEAIANGEKPKTMDAGKILGAYHDAFSKTFMTRSFLRSLLYATDENDSRPLAALESRAGWAVVDKDAAGEARILKQPKRPEDLSGYVRIPASQLRNFTWELTDADRQMLAPGFDKMSPEEQAKLFGPDDPRFPVPNGKVLAMRGDLLIHPKYADRVSDLVTKSWFDRSDSKVAATLKGIQKAGAIAKSVVLSGSLFHQVQLGVHAMEHLVNPFKLPELQVMAKDPVVMEGVGHGLNLLSVDPEGVLSDLPGMATYHRYLFRDYIPRLKAQMYKHAFERNMKRYSGELTRDELHLMTAKQANAAFGGLDPAFFEKMHRMNNRTYKAIEHMVLFSPDFTKARGQFVAQAFGKYGKEQRYALLRGALTIYAGARIANAIINNGDAKWKPQDALAIVTPKSWGSMGGKRLSLRTVQGDLMGLIEDPITWSYNRLNPVTLRPTIQFLTGRDNFGRQESKEHFAKDYLKQLTPIPVQKLFTTSEEGLVSSLFTSAGLQTGTYRSPLEKMAHQLRIAGIPDKPQSEEKQDENRRNVQMVEKLRQGKATSTDLWNLVNQGKMTPREASAVMDRSQMTELQYDVHHLSLEDAMEVYAKADASERAELHDIMEAKRDTGLKNMTQEAAEKMDKQLRDLGIE